MNNSYKLIFTGYVCIALKILNSILFQFLGLFGYILIAMGLYQLRNRKQNQIALIGTIGLFILNVLSLVVAPNPKPGTIDFILAITQIALYVILNWIMIYFMFDAIYVQFKEKRLYNDAKLSKQKKIKLMNLVFYSILCLNCAFMLPKLGAIVFLLGIGLNIYLSILQMTYFNKLSKVLA